MRVVQISDIHQGVGHSGPFPLSRYNDIDNILKWTADRIIAEKCELVLLCGDCFRDAKVMLDKASQEIASIVGFLRRLSDARIEVMIISGTPSHDAIAAYELIAQMRTPYVYVFTKPEVYFGGRAVNLAMLPGLNRSSLLTQDEYKGMPTEQVHRHMTDKITMLCQGMAAQMPDDKPKILMAHMSYQGSDKGFEDLLMQQEPILTREAVSGFDLVCLGHIHRPQQIDGKVFYSGPVERLSFNEEDITPGFWIHEMAPRNSYSIFDSQFIETPARRFTTINWDEYYMKLWLDGDKPGYGFEDAIVRLHYSCSEEIAKQINRKALEQYFYDAGAFFVSEIKADIQRVDRARDSEVKESMGPVQAVGRWCSNVGIEPEETQALCAMTAELLESGV